MKELTKEEIKFMERTFNFRKSKVEQLAYQALAMSLKADVAVFDLPYYVLMRARSIVEESFKSIDFDNGVLREARTQYLKQCLIEMKAKIIIPERKEEKDETDIRDNRCEPLSQAVASMLLDPDLIFSDKQYFDIVLKDEERAPLQSAVTGFMNALEEKITLVISQHWKEAGFKQWGKHKEDVTFSELDSVLKLK